MQVTATKFSARASVALFIGALGLASAVGCGKTGPRDGAPNATQEALSGGPYPALLLSQAWFWKDAQGKSRPGPARLSIWRQTPNGWQTTRLEDSESNVFHKALLRDGGIVTIGAEKALLKRWRLENGRWTNELLWQRAWGGQFNRLRDIEVGDVDGDGNEEYVIATHDMGVVAVVKLPRGGGKATVTELDPKANTFVHEIEIGDVDGDGKNEFFATPSGRNLGSSSQPGEIVMYRWNGSGYGRTTIASMSQTHAKEILTADLDGDGRDELYAAVEGELAQNRLVRPVEIRRYVYRKGAFEHTIVARIDDRQTRFLIAADFDGDGRKELVATAMRSGIYLITPARDATKNPDTDWALRCFETGSSGFEHATVAADLDGDGKPELYVAADDQGDLNRYVWDKAQGGFKKTRLGAIEKGGFTWNIAAGRL
jgi:hypothetical protein